MRSNPSRRTRVSRTALIICAVVVAVGGAAAGAWRIGHHPAGLARASCGSVTTHDLTGHTQVLSADRGALACFARAARKCRAASLRVTEMGVDTGTDDVFVITRAGGSCLVTEQSQAYSANFGGSQGAVSTRSCHLVAVTRGGVTLGCGGRDILIPAKAGLGSPAAA